MEPGKPALVAISEHFGNDILQGDGSLDRTQLRHRVFADVAERKWLQNLLHPLINQHLRSEIESSPSPYTVLANPLLIESRQYTWCERILVIDVATELQIERTMARDNNSRAQVENILRAQADRDTRLRHSHDVIVNHRDLAYLHQEVDALHAKYLQLAT